ncbi:retrotransposon protein, putative, ty1-copia subclass [Tanacetum coccineum]
MKDNEVWELVDLPPNGKTVGHKWLFKKKTDMDGAVHTYKARLVAKGFTQTPGIDYEETFSLVADIRDYLVKIGDEPCVYMKASESYVTFLILYVDDILIMVNNLPMLQDVKSYLGRCFAMKDLGEAAYILGIKIYKDRSKRLIGLCQSAYIKKIIKRFYMENSKRGMIPMQEKLEFSDTKRELRVSYYTDVGYLTDADNMKSQTGYVFVLNGGAVEWKSMKQKAVWIRKFISGLGVVPTIEEPINMYCDNTGAIAIAKDHGVTKGARHFHAKVHYLRETIEMDDVKIEKVDTYDNLADPFAKALAFPKHSELTKKIGMIPASSLM